MSFELAGIGTALPEHRLTQREAVELHATFHEFDETRARTLRALYRRSGVSMRHSVVLDASDGPLAERQSFYHAAEDDDDPGPATAQRMAIYEKRAPALAAAAARRALEAAEVDASAVTHLVTVSCTGFIAPGVDTAVIESLGLSRTTERTNVGFMGCQGALNGLRVARSFSEVDPTAVPLVCSVELCSLHFSYGWDPDMLVANALFADGAAAVVGRAPGGDVDRTGSHRVAWRVAATGTLLIAESEDYMTWRIGDHGFRMTLSARLPVLVETHLRGWLVDWLGHHGFRLEDVRSWAVHPGGPRILTSVENALDLSRDDTAASRAVLSEYGNMSSATILFILDRMRAAADPLPCVALAFGPGLVVEATLLA
jgi:predicted naringenin-chalcone synthase